jgi:hypothetical protein
VEASRGLTQQEGGDGTIAYQAISFATDVTAAAEYARAQCGIAASHLTAARSTAMPLLSSHGIREINTPPHHWKRRAEKKFEKPTRKLSVGFKKIKKAFPVS